MTNENKGFGSHSVAGEVSYFESHEEARQFYASLTAVGWSKDAYALSIGAAVDAFVSAKLLDLNYTNFGGEPSIGDVAAGVADNEAEWHLEAIEVNKWYSVVYAAMYAHLETVTEETAMPVEAFISSLPTFTN